MGSYVNCMQPLIDTVTGMVGGASQQSFTGLPKVAFKPKRTKRKFSKKSA